MSAWRACSPNPAGRTTAARTLPSRASATAAASSPSLTSNAASAFTAAVTAFDNALPSRSVNAIGMRVGLSMPEPKMAPKNAAMTIGARIDMTSARRFEK